MKKIIIILFLLSLPLPAYAYWTKDANGVLVDSESEYWTKDAEGVLVQHKATPKPSKTSPSFSPSSNDDESASILKYFILANTKKPASAEDLKNALTDNYINGRGFDIDERYAGAYTMGCIQTIFSIGGKKAMESRYPNCTNGEILDAVKLFYKNNPTLKYVPIIEVIASGCSKEAIANAYKKP